MKISVGADHAGYLLKNRLADILRRRGHEVVDRGTLTADSCDYPDFAAAVARDVVSGEAERGILVCSTGIGMSIAANKVPGIRAAVASNQDQVRLTRSHNDANILTLGARYTDEATAASLVDTFLETGFDGGRHARRVEKITQLEQAGPDRQAPSAQKP